MHSMHACVFAVKARFNNLICIGFNIYFVLTVYNCVTNVSIKFHKFKYNDLIKLMFNRNLSM